MSAPDANALRAAILAGELTASAAVDACLARIRDLDPRLSCFLSVDEAGAREIAAGLDVELEKGRPPGPLFGVPFALKSNLCREGAESNCGSRILAGYRAPYTATCVRRLIDADAVPVGMTNMDEFAMGSSGENSAYGPTRNPWSAECAPGGSSSGSAAAVAAGLVPLALGSDTGGSVRQPASLCGVSGFKPTYGRISRYGLIAFGSSLDQVSPLARSVRDLELAFSVLSGDDPRDATSLQEGPIQPDLEDGDLLGLRIGIPEEYLSASIDPLVRERVEEAIADLTRLGGVCSPVSLPHTPHAVSTYYVVATAEASSNLARYDGVRYGARENGDGTLQGMMAATREAGFGAEVKRRILLGTFVLSRGYADAWYDKASRVRRLLLEDFERAFEHVDVIAGPTSPTTAFALGERVADPVAMYNSDSLTTPASLAGLPALSVPCGFVDARGDRLPVGLQFTGPPREDARVLRAGRVYQGATEHHLARPMIFAGGAA